jgi:phosphinothricin acetyltransferase
MLKIAEKKDLERIVEIYNAAVPTHNSTADTTEVSVEEKRAWFEAHNPKRRPILVHEENGEVVAWVSFEEFYGRPAYDNTAEISIYVDPAFCSKGLGSRLLKEALSISRSLGIKKLVAYIFSHNEPSIRLFEKYGFEHWGRLPDIAEMDGKEYSLSILGLRLEA